jgi:phosphosulfolactate synthase
MLTIEHPRDERANRRGKTLMIDCGPDMSGWTGRHGLRDLLEVVGNYIDVAKIATLNAITMPDSYLKDTLRQYDEAGIKTFAGGLLCEYAYLKNDIVGLVERLKFLNLGGIEISENYITLDDDERMRYIGTLIDAGLEVVFEYGRKFPDKPLDLAKLEAVIERVSALGVDHVIMEQGEFDLLAMERPDDLEAMKSAPWMDSIFIEVNSEDFPNQHVAMIERFGPDVNLANVAPAHVYKLELLRRGRGRWIDYPFFRDLVAQRDASCPS